MGITVKPHLIRNSTLTEHVTSYESLEGPKAGDLWSSSGVGVGSLFVVTEVCNGVQDVPRFNRDQYLALELGYQK